MQSVRDRYPTLFSPDKHSMLLFMWQHDIVVGCFVPSLMHQSSSSSALGADKVSFIGPRLTTQVKKMRLDPKRLAVASRHVSHAIKGVCCYHCNTTEYGRKRVHLTAQQQPV